MNVESENISLNINIFVPIRIKTKGQNMDLDLLFIDNYVTIVLVFNMVFKALYRENGKIVPCESEVFTETRKLCS